MPHHAFTTRLIIFNIVSFEIGWGACALSTAQGRPLIGIAIVVMLLALHLGLSADRLSEIRLLAAVGLVGVLADSLLLLFGAFSLPPAKVPPSIIPLWSLAFHLNFATTLRASLAWLGRRKMLSAFLGSLGGVLAFEGGRRLDALTFPDPIWFGHLIIGLMWSLLTPVYFLIAEAASSRRI